MTSSVQLLSREWCRYFLLSDILNPILTKMMQCPGKLHHRNFPQKFFSVKSSLLASGQHLCRINHVWWLTSKASCDIKEQQLHLEYASFFFSTRQWSQRETQRIWVWMVCYRAGSGLRKIFLCAWHLGFGGFWVHDTVGWLWQLCQLQLASKVACFSLLPWWEDEVKLEKLALSDCLYPQGLGISQACGFLVRWSDKPLRATFTPDMCAGWQHYSCQLPWTLLVIRSCWTPCWPSLQWWGGRTGTTSNECGFTWIWGVASFVRCLV